MPALWSASEDRAARRDLEGGDTAAVQDDEPVSVPGPDHAGVVREDADDVLHDRRFVFGVGVLVPEVHVVAADEADTEHELRHGRAPLDRATHQ